MLNTEQAIDHIGLLYFRALVYYRWLSSANAETMREVLVGNYFGCIGFLIKYPLFYMLQRKCKQDLWSHGIGRHSEEELYGIAEKDMLAVSNVLGQKKFLFGEKPCLADVSLFAFIVGSCWESPTSPFSALTKSKLQNLEEHAQRMKKLCYPDWDEIVSVVSWWFGLNHKMVISTSLGIFLSALNNILQYRSEIREKKKLT